MNIDQILKAGVVWLVIAVFAVFNGVVRENILVPSLGQSIALPVSGILLSMIILIVTYASISLFNNKTEKACIFIGAQWVLMTLMFEFIFGGSSQLLRAPVGFLRSQGLWYNQSYPQLELKLSWVKKRNLSN